MKIRRIPKPHGWYAFVAAFTLVVLCLPFLKSAISEVSRTHGSLWGLIAAWLFLGFILCIAGFLIREFISQLWSWYRPNSEQRNPKAKTLR
jgi:hypothetical protein